MIFGGSVNDFTVLNNYISISKLYISGIIGYSYYYENSKYMDWYIKLNKNGFGLYTTLYFN